MPAAPKVLADRTVDDVNALHQYLLDRTEVLKVVNPEDSEEARAAWALETAMFSTFYFAQAAFSREPANAEELRSKRQLWNELCRVAAPWRNQPDYSDRWRFIYVDDPEPTAKPQEPARDEASRA